MYSRPQVQRFGSLRELTQGGSSANYDFANLNNSTCNTSSPLCWAPIPNPRS
ncbi:MAG: lasso RiPP family leader peptide-containing protein [bacterium]